MANKYSAGLTYLFQPGETSIRQQLPMPSFVPPFQYLTTDSQYDEIMADLDSVQTVSFDTETTSLQIDELVMVSFSFAYHSKVWVCLVNHIDTSLCFTDYAKLKALVWKILTRPVPFLFNARFDLRVGNKTFQINHFAVSPVDVQSLIFIADSNQKMPKLKNSSRFFLGVNPPDLPPEWLGVAMQAAPLPAFGQYGAWDAYNTLKLGEMFYSEIFQRYPLVAKLDRKLIPALMWFEDSEFDIDRTQLLVVQQEATSRMLVLQEKIYDSVGVFLLTSTQQLTGKLKSLGYDTGEVTATGQMSVKISALQKLGDVDFVTWVIEYKKLAKLNSSYIQPMLKRLDLGLPFRFHYILNNAPTMRLAAGAYNKSGKKADQQHHYFVDLNFQSVSKPKMVNRRVDWNPNTFEIKFHDEGQYLVEAGSPSLNLRKSFVPPSPDFLSSAIDYAGQELRIAANLSGESVWIEAFAEGRDIHAETAIRIWGAANYDKNKRKKAKIANFLIVYGGNEFTLMDKLGMSEAEAKEFFASYKAALPRLFAWCEQVHAIARRQGYVVNSYGMPRRLSFYYRQGGGVARFADRTAVNTLIQGAAGIIIRIGLTRLYERIAPRLTDTLKSDFYGDVLFRGTVHDELDFAIRKTRFREFLEVIVPLMVNTTPNNWVIPMDVETSVGPNWGELFPIDYKDPDLHPIEVEDKAAATVNSPADGDELFDDFEVEDEDEAFEESLLSY